MSAYKKSKGAGIVLHYGLDSLTREYWYEVEDRGLNRVVESQGTIETSAPNILIAEKMKEFACPVEHIEAVLNRRRF